MTRRTAAPTSRYATTTKTTLTLTLKVSLTTNEQAPPLSLDCLAVTTSEQGSRRDLPHVRRLAAATDEQVFVFVTGQEGDRVSSLLPTSRCLLCQQFAAGLASHPHSPTGVGLAELPTSSCCDPTDSS